MYDPHAHTPPTAKRTTPLFSFELEPSTRPLLAETFFGGGCLPPKSRLFSPRRALTRIGYSLHTQEAFNSGCANDVEVSPEVGIPPNSSPPPARFKGSQWEALAFGHLPHQTPIISHKKKGGVWVIFYPHPPPHLIKKTHGSNIRPPAPRPAPHTILCPQKTQNVR